MVEIYFLFFIIFDVLRLFETPRMFFYNFLLKWVKMKKILSPAYSLKLKNIILFFNQSLIFFSNGHISNVVSTLSNVVQFNAEKHNIVTTLFNVVNFDVDVHNVVSTLI